eukprot:evm.model.scf_4.3 EVM.evm.TU.scf_4.3   scf_4:99448-108868(-)
MEPAESSNQRGEKRPLEDEVEIDALQRRCQDMLRKAEELTTSIEADLASIAAASARLSEPPGRQGSGRAEQLACLEAQLRRVLQEKADLEEWATSRCREAEGRARAAEVARARADKAQMESWAELRCQDAERQARLAEARLEAKEKDTSPPSYWSKQQCSKERPVIYVELYRQQGTGANADQAGTHHDESIAVMMEAGVSHEDASAALKEFDGNIAEALAFHVESLANGGAGAAAEISQRAGAESARELELVLERFDAGHGPPSRASVVCVQRVQNQRLWEKYCARSSEIREAAGDGGVNERPLFHGSDMASLETITRDGFDIRVANLNGAMGAGAYFSESSSYSHIYSMKRPRGPGAPLGGGRFTFMMFPRPNTPRPTGLRQHGGRGRFRATAPLPQRMGPPRMPAIVLPRGPPAGPSARPPAVPALPGLGPGVQVPGNAGGRVVAMLLCRVALGRSARGQLGLRKPPEGFDSVTDATRNHSMYAIFDNAQAYPEYVIYYQA